MSSYYCDSKFRKRDFKQQQFLFQVPGKSPSFSYGLGALKCERAPRYLLVQASDSYLGQLWVKEKDVHKSAARGLHGAREHIGVCSFNLNS